MSLNTYGICKYVFLGTICSDIFLLNQLAILCNRPKQVYDYLIIGRGHTFVYYIGSMKCSIVNWLCCEIQVFSVLLLYICLLCCWTENGLIFLSYIGTKLTERFYDQFSPMMIYENMSWSVADSTVIRLPLSSTCMEDGVESRLTCIFDKFMEHASKPILFLKSILQVIPDLPDSRWM